MQSSLEMVKIEIVTNPKLKNIVVSCIYRAPDEKIEYYENIVDSIDKATNENIEIVLLGDLNYNYVLNETLYQNPVYLLENMFMLSQLIKDPTRVSKTSSTLLDVILTSMPEQHKHSGVYKTCFSDHYPIYTIIDIKKKPTPLRLFTFRDYETFDNERFLDDLKSITDHIDCHMPEQHDMLEHWNTLHKCFLDISNKHASFKTMKMKHRTNPWMTPYITKLMYKRNYSHVIAVKSLDKTKTNTQWDDYRAARNLVTSKITKAKELYYNNITDEYKSKPRQLWKKIR